MVCNLLNFIQFVDRKTTKKLLKQARIQQQQLEDELAEQGDVPKKSKSKSSKFNLGTRKAESDDDDEEDDDELATADDDGNEGEFAKEIV